MCMFVVEIQVQVARDNSGLPFPTVYFLREEDTAHLVLPCLTSHGFY